MDYEEIPQPVTDDEEESEPELTEAADGGGKAEFHSIIFRFVLVLLFPVIAFVSISFLIGIVAVVVGEVEYKDHSLGQTRVALAEAPDEALPANCRPNFGGAWLTKEKFKMNQTYDCWYTYGISKVSLYRDGFSVAKLRSHKKS